WDQYQSEDSVSRRHISGRPRVTTPAENRFLALSARRRRRTTVPQLVADHFVAHQGEESPLLRCEDAFTTQVSMQGDQLCVPPSKDNREGPAYVGQENTFPRPDSNGLLYSSQTSPDSHWRAIQGVC
ncbi:hypothetical protein AVEN_207627-1, partial [Araneus ventricosus]